MIPFIVSLYLSCPLTQMFNETNQNWTKYDFQILNQANKRCGEIYQDSPCVKKFYKRPEQSYWVVCGKGVTHE